MKKLSFVFCLFALFLTSQAFSQDGNENNEPRNEIGLELTGILDGQYQIFYERSLSEHWSIGLGVGGKTESGLLNISGIDSPSIKTGGYKLFRIQSYR